MFPQLLTPQKKRNSSFYQTNKKLDEGLGIPKSVFQVGHKSESVPKRNSSKQQCQQQPLCSVYRLNIPQISKILAVKVKRVNREEKDRESLILRQFQDFAHPNIIKLQHTFISHIQGCEFMNIVTDYMPSTLQQLIVLHRNKKRMIPSTLVKLFVFQIIRGVAFLHENSIIHRNICPENLLINNTTFVLKLCDFGSAKFTQRGDQSLLEVGNRCFRAPEVLLGSKSYSEAIDLWSIEIGCIIVELLTLQSPFEGQSNEDVFTEIIKCLGTPTQNDLIKMGSPVLDLKLPQIKPKDWRTRIPLQVPDDGASLLIDKLLQYQPSKRARCFDYLTHPFFSELLKPNLKINSREIPRIYELTSGQYIQLISLSFQEEMKIPIYALNAHKIVPDWYALPRTSDESFITDND